MLREKSTFTLTTPPSGGRGGSPASASYSTYGHPSSSIIPATNNQQSIINNRQSTAEATCRLGCASRDFFSFGFTSYETFSFPISSNNHPCFPFLFAWLCAFFNSTSLLALPVRGALAEVGHSSATSLWLQLHLYKNIHYLLI